jgi:hypothetical protein
MNKSEILTGLKGAGYMATGNRRLGESLTKTAVDITAPVKRDRSPAIAAWSLSKRRENIAPLLTKIGKDIIDPLVKKTNAEMKSVRSKMKDRLTKSADTVTDTNPATELPKPKTVFRRPRFKR